MSRMQELEAQRAAAMETAADMTEVVSGGGNARLLPAGPAIVQLISYVELGMQPQTFNGVAKPAKAMVQLGFAIYGPQYANEDGTPYIMYPYAFTLDQNEKAKAIAIFKAMNWEGNSTHFSQFLGKYFVGKIVHERKSKADEKIVSRLDLKAFAPPLDAMTGKPYTVPAVNEDMLEWFFFDQPTVASWNALYREGAFDDGGSKNRIQETITGATNFVGSALEAMLVQNKLPIPIAKPKAAKAAEPTGVQAALPQVGGTPVADPLPQTGSVVTPVTTVVSQPVIAQPVVMNAPIVPGVTFPSNPALPKVG